MADVTLEALLQEGRTFPPSDALHAATRSSPTRRSTTRPSADSEGVLGRARPRELLDWFERVGHDPRVGPAVREVVRRRQAQRRRTTASTATSRPATATRSRTTGRASPATPAPSPTPSCSTTSCRARQRAARSSASRRATGSAIYLGMVPELADRDARVRPHRRRRTRSCSAASSSDSLRDRINDAEAKVLITGDGAWRRGSVVPLKEIADAAMAETPVDRAGASCCAAPSNDVAMQRRPRRLVARRSSPQQSDRVRARADGRRGPALPPLHERAPPGSPRASCTRPAATSPRSRSRTSTCSTSIPTPTSTGAPPTRLGDRPLVHRLRPAREPRDERACTRARPTIPDKDRLWSIVEKYKVTILYTAPTAIRTFMKWGDRVPRARTTCRRCGCSAAVGEPINPEAWVWYWQAHRRRALPGRRHVVADRDRRHHDQPAARRDDAEARAARRSRCPASAPTSSTTTASRSAIPGGGYLVLDPAVAVDAARHLGRPASATATRTGRASTAGTSPATAPSATTTATSGCSAGSTTSCSSSGHNISTTEVESRARRPPRGRRGRGRRARPTRRPARRSPRS